IAGRGNDSNRSEHGGERILGACPHLVLSGKDDCADYGDGIQRVGQRHQRSVQQRRDAADHLKPDERRQHKNVQAGNQIQLHHFGASSFCARAGSAYISRNLGFATSPPCVTNVSRMISSFIFSCSLPSFTSSSRNVATFFAYIWLAWYGTELARLIGPISVTPCSTTCSPGLVSSQFPPRSAAKSTSTEPGAMPATISLVTRIGAFFPGITAVVMTTSFSAITFPSSSRWRR